MLRIFFPSWVVGYIDSSTGFAIMRSFYTKAGANRSRLFSRHGEELGLLVKKF